MKKILNITAVLVLCNLLFLNAQNGKAFYEKNTIESYNLKDNKVNSELKDALSNTKELLSSFKFILEFNSEFAHYSKEKNMDDDSFQKKIALSLSGFKGDAYFDKKNKVITISKNIADESFLIKKDFDSIKWELTKEKLYINDFVCYKAKTMIKEEGRRGVKNIEVIAWYTPEINIPFGPDGFGGLPGLIIQLEKGNVITSLKRINFINSDIIIELPTKGKVVTETEYNKFVKDLVMNREKYFKN